MKILIVGGVAAGAGAAARLRRLDEEAEIIIFDKGPYVSYSNCSLPYRLSDMVDSDEKLIMMNPEQFLARYNIIVRTRQEVVSINRKDKTIVVKTEKGTYSESYDKLILATGTNAFVPPVQGIETADVFTLKTVDDTTTLYRFLKEKQAKQVSIVGGGFIGIEAAVNLKEAGYDVTVVEALPQILNTFDYDMVQILQKEMIDHGVNVITGDKLVSFDHNNMTLASGKIIESDAILMSVGVRPDTRLAKDAGLTLNARGAIIVDANYQTSDPDIYAAGDAIEVSNAITGKPMMLALAGPAQKEARTVADHIMHRPVHNTGFIGSNCIKVFDYNAAATGLSAAQCEKAGIPYDSVYVIPQDRVSIMPGAVPMHYKLIYRIPDGTVLGVQAVSKGDAPKKADIAATVIHFHGTIYDLMDLELCYAPPFSTAREATIFAGMTASNLLEKTFRQVKVTDVRKLVEEGAYILDVREEMEYDAGHIVNAINIPLSQLRKRIHEVPKDKPVYVHCRTGQRSYNAVLALQAHGYDNVYNISGSFLGLCFYEYYNDKTTGRKPIVTQYNFN